MSQELYSVEQVAERLGLHARTVRGYIREGRLSAVRIGKQYRITRGDLDAFTGQPAPSAAARHVEVSSIVEMDGVDMDAAMRMTNALMGTMNTRGGGEPLMRAETLYDRDRQRMKFIVVGGLDVTRDLLKLIGIWGEAYR
ncbi:helix-turn-helix domain-containing protein [Phenylobacterium sp.]|uniref:helix-turn-helix domain-containing protein n=1 Tax=Phenylobacterium sp. TaxID=1871053 RepID=UPI002FCB0CBF